MASKITSAKICGRQFVEESPISLQAGCNPTSSATPRRYVALGNAHQDKRVSRLMGKTLSFSKKLENHIGTIGLFIYEYNCVIQKKISDRTRSSFSSVFS